MSKFERNLGPEYSLTVEDWIPVLRSGQTQPELVSLAVLFEQADQFVDLAEANPIVRASLFRFLISMTYLVVIEEADGGNPRKVSRSLVDKGKGFSTEAVKTVLSDWDHALWLFHPETPFLQDPRMAEDTSLKKPLGPLAVTPFLPGGSSSRWGVNLEASASVSLDEAARRLITTWFYTPSGNSSRRTDPADSSCQSKRVLSASGSNFPTLSHFFRKGSSVFETLVANLLTSHFPSGSERSSPAFLQVTDLELNIEEIEPLYAATLSAATALIVETEPGQKTLSENFLRGSTLLDGSYKDPAARLKARSFSHDPHTIYKDNPTNEENHPRFSLKGSFVSLPLFCLELNREASTASALSFGVVRKRETVLGELNAPNTIEIFQLEHGGNASGRLIAGTHTYVVPAEELSPFAITDDDESAIERAHAITEMIEALLDERKSARIFLIQAMKNAIAPKNKVLDSLATRARDELLSATGRSVAQAISSIGRDGPDGFDRKAAYQVWANETMRIFDSYCAPVRESHAGSERYWNERGYLTHKLKGRLGTYPNRRENV